MGVDQDEVGDELRMPGGDGERDGAAETVADQRCASDLEPRVQVGDGFGEGVDAIGEARRRWDLALAEAGQVRRDHPEGVAESRSHAVPGAVVDEQPVQQHDPWSVTFLCDAQTYAAGGDVAVHDDRHALQGTSTRAPTASIASLPT